MLLTIIIILVSICVFLIIRHNSKTVDDIFHAVLFEICVIILGIALPFYLEIPEDTKSSASLVEKIELVSLSNDLGTQGKGFIYVSVSSDNIYSYRYEINSEFNTESSKAYKVATLCGNNIIEIEDPNCNKPVLQIYEVTYDATLWTHKRTVEEYVFYVPEGTILKDVQLS